LRRRKRDEGREGVSEKKNKKRMCKAEECILGGENHLRDAERGQGPEMFHHFKSKKKPDAVAYTCSPSYSGG
jgi:hypothetical protein